MTEIENWLAIVRSARPATAPDSPWAPAAQSVLEHALRGDRHRHAQRRRAQRAGLALGLATACAVVAALVSLNGAPSPAAGPSHRFPSAAGASAAVVLDRAAFVALGTPGPKPRGDQYVYSRIEQTGGRVVQSWMSVNGTRDSVVGSLRIAGCRHGHLMLSGPGGGGACTPVRAYFPAMPTRVHGMLAYLERTQGVRLSNLNDLAKVVGSLLDTDYLLPAQQAALFHLLASTRGLTVVPHVVDPAGRAGVGVSWGLGGSRAVLVFDPRTYTYLGTVTRGVAGQISGDARLSGGIVDAPGQQPGASSTTLSS